MSVKQLCGSLARISRRERKNGSDCRCRRRRPVGEPALWIDAGAKSPGVCRRRAYRRRANWRQISPDTARPVCRRIPNLIALPPGAVSDGISARRGHSGAWPIVRRTVTYWPAVDSERVAQRWEFLRSRTSRLPPTRSTEVTFQGWSSKRPCQMALEIFEGFKAGAGSDANALHGV